MVRLITILIGILFLVLVKASGQTTADTKETKSVFGTSRVKLGQHTNGTVTGPYLPQPDSVDVPLTEYQERQVVSLSNEVAKAYNEYLRTSKERDLAVALILDFNRIVIKQGESIDLKPGKLIIVKPKP